MTWFKVDDSFHSNPKVLATSAAALGLWVVAGAWSSASLTDGFVPEHALPRLMPDAEPLANELVERGLWRRARGGYRFHDWKDYNPRAVDVKREREAARERMRNLRANRKVNNKSAGQTPKRSGEQQANVREVFVTPSRPDPTRPGSSPNGELRDAPPASPGPPTDDPPPPTPTRQESRGTRLPDEFPVTDAMAEWAREKAPSCGGPDHEAFCDYWRAAPGAKGRKLDWVATWRNWMRREHERRGSGTTHRRPTAHDPDSRIAEIQALKRNPPPANDRPLNLIQGELA